MTLEKKYSPLANYFSAATNSTLILHLAEIEKIIGQNLPHSAYLNQGWWRKKKTPSTHSHAWLDAGYVVKEFHPNRSVSFKRMDLLDKNEGNKAKTRESEDILLIRPTGQRDIHLLADLQKKIEGASDFLSVEKEERALSTQKEENQINRSIIFLAILNSQPVGYLKVTGNEDETQHSTVLLGIQTAARGKGIGSSLLQKAEDWAITKAISRLEICVLDGNNSTQKFCEKNGYRPAGIRRKSVIIRNKMYSEIAMVKILDD